MTKLEVILIAIIWIGYGIYTFTIEVKDKRGEFFLIVWIILFSPLVFIFKALRGAFT